MPIIKAAIRPKAIIHPLISEWRRAGTWCCGRGGPGAVLKDVTSSESLKSYAVSGVTAGLTTGLYDGWTGTETAPSSLPGNSGLLANNGAVRVPVISGGSLRTRYCRMVRLPY
ncbi:DUF637 domain-containing protein [Stutzerimonas nitrititolerans]|uniref:DUF637 domain-containing protein n=1 Tax=Stutzerimonas nitrititolerans TaxID=2482751 RepID=UPI0035E3E9BC